MKRLRAAAPALLLFVALLGAAACGSSAPEAEPQQPPGQGQEQEEQEPAREPSGAQAGPPYLIGVSNVSVANSWRVQMIAEFRAAAEQRPELIEDVVVTDAGGDANKQIADIEDLLAQQVDALIVAPASPTAIAPAVAAAYDSGIPVIVFNTDVDTDKVTARVFPTYHEWAQQTAEWLVEAMGGQGNVIALRGIAGLDAEADEWAGVEKVLEEYPDIRVICSEFADWAYDKAKTAMANCLANNPEVHGIASIGDAMTWAAAEVLKDRGYDVTRIPMIGIGGSNGFLKYWQQNDLNAYVIADPTSISVTALDAALAALQGEPVEATQAPPTYVIDNETLARFVKPDLPDSAWVGSELPDDVLKNLLGK